MTEQTREAHENEICEERPIGKQIVGAVSLSLAVLMLLFDLSSGSLTIWPLLAGLVGVGALIHAHIERKRFEAQANPCAAPPPVEKS